MTTASSPRLEAEIRVELGALDLDVALAVEPGETLAMLGPNGAGKSTILRCVAGLQPIDAGRIVIDGVVVDQPATRTFVVPAGRSVGIVFQDYLLFEHLTVADNVAFPLRARRTRKPLAAAAAAAWLERLGLAGHAAAAPASLSGGEAQRVALARALVGEPRVLLLDEPLAALDAATRSVVRRQLAEHLAGQPTATAAARVIVTHDPVDAYALADRVAVVEAGRIVQTGTLPEIATRPRTRYVADLVGVNLIAGTVGDGVLRSAGGAEVAIADAAAGPTLAMIKPHSVMITRTPPADASVRNVWRGRIIAVDRLGDRVRVSIDSTPPITSEITTAALTALGLALGDEVYAAVKATDIETYPD